MVLMWSRATQGTRSDVDELLALMLKEHKRKGEGRRRRWAMKQ